MVSNLKRKRGTSGTAALYATRNQALARLQLRLPEFRRLCILKGVHPREPKRKVAGQNKTYYHVKDIAFLAHEPLLVAFRAARTHGRKVRRALAKNHAAGAARLAAAAPRYALDHLVRERYPSFGDALRDVDDPLTLVHLFGALPAERGHGIPAERVQTARRCARACARERTCSAAPRGPLTAPVAPAAAAPPCVRAG
jgi:pescadillo protein